MARIRTIKPEFPHSESMGKVSRDARLAFILLWTIADDHGRLRGNSRMLASLLFPYDDDAPKQIDRWLDQLERERCITRYQAEGSSYVQIEKWSEHQRVDKPSQSRIPECREDSRALARIREPSCEDQGPRTKDQGKDQGKDHGPRPPDQYQPEFEAFWRTYPKNNGSKKEAADAYLKATKKGVTHEAVIRGAERYARYVTSRHDGAKFTKHASSWLNGQFWESAWDVTANVGGRADDRPTWRSEGERLVARYLEEAQQD